jgi:hypothetical protein
MGNNWVSGIDPKGTEYSPIFDIATGDFLGTDSEGYKGKILFMDKNQYMNITHAGRHTLSHETALKMSKDMGWMSLNMNEQRLAAVSNAFTHILSRMKDINFSRLYKGKISGYSYWENITYNDGLKLWANASMLPVGKEIKVTANFINGDQPELFNTVANVQNLLGVHEYYLHGIVGITQNNETTVYKRQMQHPTFNQTTEYFQNYYRSKF